MSSIRIYHVWMDVVSCRWIWILSLPEYIFCGKTVFGKDLLIFLCNSILPACQSVYHVYSLCQCRPEKGVRHFSHITALKQHFILLPKNKKPGLVPFLGLEHMSTSLGVTKGENDSKEKLNISMKYRMKRTDLVKKLWEKFESKQGNTNPTNHLLFRRSKNSWPTSHIFSDNICQPSTSVCITWIGGQ